MNATPLPDNIYQEAKDHADLVKDSFARTWNNVQSAVESFSAIIHRQTQQIRTLETQTVELQKALDEKKALADSLEAKITDLTQSFNAELETKQKLVGERAILIEAARRGSACILQLREDAKVNETRYQEALSQVEVLQKQLSEKNIAKEDDRQRDLDSESIEEYVKKEVEARSEEVRRAAIAVANEVAEANKSYHESQARVVSLEEELRKTKRTVEKMTKSLQEGQSIPVTMPDRGSSGTATPSRIISGMYRPKPPRSNTSKSTTPTVVPSISGKKPTSPVFASSLNVPPPLPIDTSASSTHNSTRDTEVIDLTFSPVETPGSVRSISSDAPPTKRRRVGEGYGHGPYVSPRVDEMNLQQQIQGTPSNNVAMRAGYDMSQEPDQRHRVN